MISIMALHTLSTHSWLVHKAAKKDVATLEKYTREGERDGSDYSESSDDEDRIAEKTAAAKASWNCLLYTSPSPRDATLSRMPSSA